MSKPLKLVLILSIAINAIWLIGVAAGWFSIGKTITSITHAPNAAQAGNGGGGGNGSISALSHSPETAKEVAALLSTNDAAVLRDQLRALGLSSDVVRDLVEARILSRYETRRREITEAARAAAAQRPYWCGRLSPSDDLTVEQQCELNILYVEGWRQVRQVLGRDGEIISQAQLVFPALPAEKAERLVDMNNDYYYMRQEAIQKMSGFRMPGDDAKFKLLDEEHKRDVDAMLTPEEKQANDLRNSTAALRVQNAFAGINGTEDEYKTIVALQNAVYGKYPENSYMSPGRALDTPEFRSAREAALKEVDAQIREFLGDKRHADYLREQREDYQTLQAAARRFSIGADTVAQTYQARDHAAHEAARISSDTSLGTGQKNEAYAALAGRATGQIRAALGDDIGDAYINNALAWLKNLPKGGNVEIDPAGNVKVTQSKQ
jgi:hypothetical protein